MALFPTGAASIRIRVLPKVPAIVQGGDGVSAELSGGILTVGLDFESLQSQEANAAPATTHIAAWSEADESYYRISVEDFITAVGEVAEGLVGSIFGRTGTVVAVAGDYEADEVTFTPAGGIAATDVQAALVEVQSNVAAATAGAVVNVTRQVFTATGTYTPTAGMIYADIECQAAGGGGGGTVTGPASYTSAGAGGGGGGYSKKRVTASDVGASKAVTVGAVGSAGTAGNNAGGNAADTSVGTLCIGKGGSGGGGGPGVGVAAGGAGGVAGTGDYSLPGQPGQATTPNFSFVAGRGGDAHMGHGAQPTITVTAAAGSAGGSYGGGGSGGASYNAGGTAAGGAGGPGIVIVTEYIGA